MYFLIICSQPLVKTGLRFVPQNESLDGHREPFKVEIEIEKKHVTKHRIDSIDILCNAR